MTNTYLGQLLVVGTGGFLGSGDVVHEGVATLEKVEIRIFGTGKDPV
jgi:hypothetical protein